MRYALANLDEFLKGKYLLEREKLVKDNKWLLDSHRIMWRVEKTNVSPSMPSKTLGSPCLSDNVI